MKIAVLSFEFPPGTGSIDAEMFAFEHAHALGALGHEVTVFAAEAPDETTAVGRPRGTTAFHDGIAVTRLDDSASWARRLRGAAGAQLDGTAELLAEAATTARALRQRLRDERFDLVESRAFGAEALLLEGLDLPVVVRAHELPGGEETSMDAVLQRLLHGMNARTARACTASSRWLLDRLQDWAHPAHLTVQPPGILLEPRAPASATACRTLREQLDCGDAKIVLCAGEHAADAAGIAASLDAIPVILGAPKPDAPRPDAPRPDAPDGGGRVYVPCPTAEQRHAWLTIADAVVFADDRASAPRLCLEAMADRRPIVAYAAGGLPELLGVHAARLVSPGDSDAMLNELGRLLEDHDLRQRTTEVAHERVQRHFSIAAVAERSTALYGTLLGRPALQRGHTTAAPRTLLGPEDWFTAWWVAGTPPRPPTLAQDRDGTALLSHASLDGLRLVDAVLMDSFNAGPNDWQSPEAAFLNAVHRLHVDTARAIRHGERTAAPNGLGVALPPWHHPLFGGDHAATLTGQLGRILHREEAKAWLAEQAEDPAFARAARNDSTLRRLAIMAAQQRPNDVTFAALRTIYRDPDSHAAVAAADRALGDDDFVRQVAAFGLYAPLERPRYAPAAPPSPAATDEDAARITVLIPSYRHERFVQGAVQSALQQSCAGVRVLVVDDRSPDATVERVLALDDPRVEVRVNERNLGLGQSVAQALAGVETPFVALLNSDDLFHPDRLARCIEQLEADPQAGLVATGLSFCDGEDRLLTAETSCCVDVGPQTHGWLQWYAGLQQETELSGETDDLISVAALFRHNHLATSSNMVFRTDYLRQHLGDVTHLKYTLDWMLFLIAAIEGRLRYLPEPLMAYRFHGSNTVWFADGGRAGYVLEVNDVVARGLRRLMQERTARGDAAAAAREVLDLLAHHVPKHGESDGYALGFELLRLATDTGSGSESLDEDAVDAFIKTANERSEREAVLGPLDASPWQLRALAEDLDRLANDSHTAELFAQRAAEMESQRDWLRAEAARLGRTVSDAYASKRQAEERQHHAERRLEEQQKAAERRTKELQQQLQRRDQKHGSLASERDTLAAELSSTKAERTELEAKVEQLTAEMSREWQRLHAVVDKAREAQRIAEAQLIRQRDAARREAENQDIVARERAAADRARRAELLEARSAVLRQQEQDSTTQAGRFALETLRLAPLWKTLRRFGALGRARGNRLRGAFERGDRTRIAWLAHGPLSVPVAEATAWRARGLTEAGVDVTVFAFGARDRSALLRSTPTLRRQCVVLPDDDAVRRADRAAVEADCDADALARVQAMLVRAPRARARVWSAARTAKARGVRLIAGPADGEAGLMVRAVATLLGCAYVVEANAATAARVARTDQQPLREVLTGAASILVDAVPVRGDLAHRLDLDPDAFVIAPPTTYPEGESHRIEGAALLAAPLQFQALPTLVQIAADFPLVLSEPNDLGGLQALEELRDLLRDAGRSDRLTVLPEDRAHAVARGGADVVLSLMTRNGAGLSSQLALAMAHGVPTLCTSESSVSSLLGETDVIVADPGVVGDRLRALGEQPGRDQASERARLAAQEHLSATTVSQPIASRIARLLPRASIGGTTGSASVDPPPTQG